MSRDWDDLVESMREEIKNEYLAQDGDTRNMSDFLGELIDGLVPVYNSDRLDLVNDNHDLAYADSNSLDLMHDPVESIYDFLAVTIYCALEEEANKYINDLDDDVVRCGRCDVIIELDGDRQDCMSKKDDTLCQKCCDEKEEEDEGCE